METTTLALTKVIIWLEGRKVEIPFDRESIAKKFEKSEEENGFTNALAHFWHYHSLVLPEETLRKIPVKRLFEIAKRLPNNSRVITQIWEYLVTRLLAGERFSIQRREITRFVIEKSHYQTEKQEKDKYMQLIEGGELN